MKDMFCEFVLIPSSGDLKRFSNLKWSPTDYPFLKCLCGWYLLSLQLSIPISWCSKNRDDFPKGVILGGFLILINLPIQSNSTTMLSRFAVAARSGVTAVKYSSFERWTVVYSLVPMVLYPILYVVSLRLYRSMFWFPCLLFLLFWCFSFV